MLKVTALGGGIVRAPAEVNYTAIANITSNTLTPSFTSIAIGTAVAGRRVVVGTENYYTTDVPTVSSMAIIGETGAEVHDAAPTGTVHVAEIWDAVVDTGTSGTIAPVWGGAPTGYSCGIIVWEVHTVSGAASDTDDDFQVGGTTASVTVTVPAGGVVIAYATFGNNPGTLTWVGVDEDVAATAMCDADCTLYQAGASKQYVSGGETVVSVDVATSSGGRLLVVAVYSPA
jgi:hypothetical protein